MSGLSTRGRGIATTRPGRPSTAWPGDHGSPSTACDCHRDTGRAGPAQAGPTSQALPTRAPPQLRPCAPARRTAQPWRPGQPRRPAALPAAGQPGPVVALGLAPQPGRGVRPGSHGAPPTAVRSATRPDLGRRFPPPASGLREVVQLLPLMPLRCCFDILMVSLWRHFADLSPRVTGRGEPPPPVAPGRLRRPAAPVAGSATAFDPQVKTATRPPRPGQAKPRRSPLGRGCRQKDASTPASKRQDATRHQGPGRPLCLSDASASASTTDSRTLDPSALPENRP